MSELSEFTITLTIRESTLVEKPTGAGDLPGMHHSYRLDDRNYLQWAQLVRTFLNDRGKINHLTTSPPKDSDSTFTAWDVEDSLIMAWLWSAMQPKVSKNFMFLSLAKEIWEIVRQTYSKVEDASMIFEIKSKIGGTKQGQLTVTEYYNRVRGLWLELDHYQDIKMVCSEDATTLNRIFERDDC